MWQISNGEILLYGGIFCMGAAAVLGVVAGVIFTVTGRKLRKKLEQEYGEPASLPELLGKS